MVREIRRKKRSVYNLIIIFFFCVFFLLPTISSAVATSPFKDVSIGTYESQVNQCGADDVSLDPGVIIGNAACCAKHTNTQIDVNSCVSNLYDDQLNHLTLTGTYSSCTQSGTPVASTNNNCYQKVTLKDSSGGSTVGNYFYNSTAPTKVDKCSSVGTGKAGVDFCAVTGADNQCLSTLGEATINGQVHVCCHQIGKTGTDNIWRDVNGESLCKEAAVTIAPCDLPAVLSSDAEGSKVCCTPLSDAQLVSQCSEKFKTATDPTPTCEVDNSSYKNASCSITDPFNIHCGSCTVNIKNKKTNAIAQALVNKTPTNPGSNTDPNTNTGTVAPDNTPKYTSCGVMYTTDKSVDTAKDCCTQNAATISDKTKHDAELNNCITCLGKGANYSWSGLGCINTSTEGIVLSILRIFYGIGTGLLVLRIVIAGIKLINNPDSPDTLKDSKQEVTSSILAFVFGVLSLIILRFIGINVLGITWIDGLLPKLV